MCNCSECSQIYRPLSVSCTACACCCLIKSSSCSFSSTSCSRALLVAIRFLNSWKRRGLTTSCHAHPNRTTPLTNHNNMAAENLKKVKILVLGNTGRSTCWRRKEKKLLYIYIKSFVFFFSLIFFTDMQVLGRLVWFTWFVAVKCLATPAGLWAVM